MVCNFKARKVNKVNNENYIKAKSGVISIQIVMMLIILIWMFWNEPCCSSQTGLVDELKNHSQTQIYVGEMMMVIAVLKERVEIKTLGRVETRETVYLAKFEEERNTFADVNWREPEMRTALDCKDDVKN